VREQRKSRRFDLKLPIELLRRDEGSRLQIGETMNVSSSGVLFCSQACMDPGDNVEYVITFPRTSANVEVRLHCKGKIIRRIDSQTAATLERWEFQRMNCVGEGRH
jgi:hypothetical protein